jgi:hypothetical protein
MYFILIVHLWAVWQKVKPSNTSGYVNRLTHITYHMQYAHEQSKSFNVPARHYITSHATFAVCKP